MINGRIRINLWRRAISLFEKTNQETGPFYEAGYTQYYCEGKSDEKLTPDIFGMSESHYCVCDVSFSKCKGETMDKYIDCTPSDYIKSIFPCQWNSAGYPFLITDQLNLTKYFGYNLLQVEPPGEVTIEKVDDPQLEAILQKWGGFMYPPPSYQLLAVPESTPEELKAPMASVLKWACTQENPITLEQIVEKLLGHLYTSFSKSSRAELRSKVHDILDYLSKSFLKDYIKYDTSDKLLVLKVDVTQAPTRKAFSSRLNNWLKVIPIEYYDDDEEELELETDSDLEI